MPANAMIFRRPCSREGAREQPAARLSKATQKPRVAALAARAAAREAHDKAGPGRAGPGRALWQKALARQSKGRAAADATRRTGLGWRSAAKRPRAPWTGARPRGRGLVGRARSRTGPSRDRGLHGRGAVKRPRASWTGPRHAERGRMEGGGAAGGSERREGGGGTRPSRRGAPPGGWPTGARSADGRPAGVGRRRARVSGHATLAASPLRTRLQQSRH